MCLLLGATGVGKTLLLKRYSQLTLRNGTTDLGEPPVTLPTVGTNLTDLTLKRKRVTVRELGGCMGPIWPSYYTDCSSVIFMVDSANTTQMSSSCIQLLSVLSAEPLHTASVLVIFNKRSCSNTLHYTTHSLAKITMLCFFPGDALPGLYCSCLHFLLVLGWFCLRQVKYMLNWIQVR
uniref:ARF like GTPase 16 n=1 Tax=Hucho hucho TaxID=62062 RepID=A0A4W5MJ17_9TELE